MTQDYTSFTPISESISFSASDTRAKITFLAPWDLAILYAQEVIPQVITVAGTAQYFQGAPHARLDGIFVTNVDIAEFGDYDPSGGDWPTAKVTTTYGPPSQDDEQSEDGVEIGTLAYDLSGEELVLPKAGAKVGSTSGDNLDEKDNARNPIKIVPKGGITLQFKFRPQRKPDEYDSLIGKVNDGTWKGFPAETLMFQGLTTNTGKSSDGTQTWSWGLKFEYQPNNWNKEFIDGSWQYIFINGNKLYEEDDFDGLL